MMLNTKEMKNFKIQKHETSGAFRIKLHKDVIPETSKSFPSESYVFGNKLMCKTFHYSKN